MANSLGDMVVKILGDISDFDKKLGEAEKKMKGSAENIGKMGKSLTMFVTAPLLGIGAAALKASADMEMLEANFTTMLGSATRAKSLLAQLKDLAARTPFSLKDLATASQTLMQFGVNVDDIMPTLKSLGDVSGGNADRFSRLALAFGQTQSAGRLMGQDLLQMINAGFNPLQEISKTTGISMAELKAQMEKGAITADMISESFKRASASGGQFFGGMERGSQTLQGQVSTLMDELAGLGREFGTILLPVAKDMVTTLTGLAKQFQGLSESSKGMVVTVAALAAAVGPLVFMLSKLPAIIEGTRLAMALLSANPVILGLTAVAVAGIAIANAFNQARANFTLYEKARAASATQEERLRALAAAQKVIDTDDLILKRARIESGNKQLTMQQALVDKDYEAYQQAIQTVSSVTKLVQAYENKVIAAEAAAIATVAENKATAVSASAAMTLAESITDVTQATSASSDMNRRWLQGMVDTAEALNTMPLEETGQAATDMYTAWAEGAKKSKVRTTELLEEAKKITPVLDSAMSILKPTIEAMGSVLVKEGATWKDWASVAVNSIGNVVSALGDQLAAKSAAALIEAFAMLAGVVTAPLAPGFFGQSAIYAGGAAAAWATAGALKAVKFAEGGIVMPRSGGTFAQVAEAGQPEVIFPLDELKRFLGGTGRGAEGGDIRLVVNIDSQPILEKIFPATRNRTVLISSGAVV